MDDSKETKSYALVERIIFSAESHGDASEREHQVGDLEDALRRAWDKLSPKNRLEIYEKLDLWERAA